MDTATRDKQQEYPDLSGNAGQAAVRTDINAFNQTGCRRWGRRLMTSPGYAVAEFLTRVTDWARHQPTLSGVALVGSHARGDARPDSDIDLVLLCGHPNIFLDDTSWARLLGEVAACQTEDWGMVTSLRVSYRNGLEVEFGLTTPAWARFPIDAGTRQVVSNGMRILLDKEEALGRLQHAVSKA